MRPQASPLYTWNSLSDEAKTGTFMSFSIQHERSVKVGQVPKGVDIKEKLESFG